MIAVKNLSKTFTLHNQGGAVIEVLRDAAFSVAPGECVGLVGASGAGKSTLMRMIWGNYLAASGSIMVNDTDLTRAAPREIIALRRTTLGYVSQFLLLAQQKFAGMIVLHLTASPAVLAERLAGRGRETADQIAARLGRNVDPLPAGLNMVTVSNDGELAQTVRLALTALYPDRG